MSRMFAAPWHTESSHLLILPMRHLCQESLQCLQAKTSDLNSCHRPTTRQQHAHFLLRIKCALSVNQLLPLSAKLAKKAKMPLTQSSLITTCFQHSSILKKLWPVLPCCTKHVEAMWFLTQWFSACLTTLAMPTLPIAKLSLRVASLTSALHHARSKFVALPQPGA